MFDASRKTESCIQLRPCETARRQAKTVAISADFRMMPLAPDWRNRSASASVTDIPHTTTAGTVERFCPCSAGNWFRASKTVFAPKPLSITSTSVLSAPVLSIHSAGDACAEPNAKSSVDSSKCCKPWTVSGWVSQIETIFLFLLRSRFILLPTLSLSAALSLHLSARRNRILSFPNNSAVIGDSVPKGNENGTSGFEVASMELPGMRIFCIWIFTIPYIAATGQTPTPSPAESIWADYVKAVGGEAAVDRFTSRETVAELHRGPHVTLYWEKPNHVLSVSKK